jgi:hypothetical protein
MLFICLWDVLDEADFPFPIAQFDMIISSVVIPYFDDGSTILWQAGVGKDYPTMVLTQI